MRAIDAWTLASCIFGILLLVWKGKRSFSRLNSLGVEQFKSYGHKLTASLLDAILFGGGMALLAIGGFMFVAEHEPTIGGLLFLAFLAVGVERIFHRSP